MDNELRMTDSPGPGPGEGTAKAGRVINGIPLLPHTLVTSHSRHHCKSDQYQYLVKGFGRVLSNEYPNIRYHTESAPSGHSPALSAPPPASRPAAPAFSPSWQAFDALLHVDGTAAAAHRIR